MQSVRLLLLAVCATFALANANAEPRALDTYKSIIDRNPFGLKDPPPPPPPVSTNNTAKEKKEEFYLTGISTIGNVKRPKAYLLCKDTNKKEYDQKYYNLMVGDRQGELQLLDVDVKGRRVKVTYQGEEKWLSMKDNGVPAPTGPAPGAPGAIPNAPAVPGMHPPGAVPVPLPAAPQPLSSPAPVSSNRRTPRIAGNTYGGGYNGGMMNAMAPVGAVGTMPTVGTVGTAYGTPATTGAPGANGANGASTPPPPTEVDIAKQYIMMNANYQNALKQGNILPPPPPAF